MYQTHFDEIIKIINDNNDIFIVSKNVKQENTPDYFIYNDNQSNGETIKKLCQI